MLPITMSCVSGLSRSQRAERRRHAGGTSRVDVQVLADDREARRRRSASRSRATRTFSSRSSCLSSPAPRRLDERVLVLRLLAASTARGARAHRNVANAARRPTSRCSGTGTFSRGRCAPANDRYGAVDRYIAAAGRQHARALAQVAAARRPRARSPRATAPGRTSASAERQRHAVGQREVQVAHAALAAEPRAGVLEPRRQVDADDRRASSANDSGMPPPPQPASRTRPRNRHAGLLEERDDLRAAVVLEQRVVVLRPEPEVGVRLDGAFVNPAHARSIGGKCAVAPAGPNLSMSAARSWPAGRFGDVERRDDRDDSGTRRARPG